MENMKEWVGDVLIGIMADGKIVTHAEHGVVKCPGNGESALVVDIPEEALRTASVMAATAYHDVRRAGKLFRRYRFPLPRISPGETPEESAKFFIAYTACSYVHVLTLNVLPCETTVGELRFGSNHLSTRRLFRLQE